MSHLTFLPEEIVLKIILLLSFKDILSLSSISTYFYNILSQEEIWRRILKRDKITVSKHVQQFIRQNVENQAIPLSKLYLIVEHKLHTNWLTKNCKKTKLGQGFNEHCYDSGSDCHIVKSDNHVASVHNCDRSVHVWDLCSLPPMQATIFQLKKDKKFSIVFVLENYLVTGYFDDFSLSLTCYSLQSSQLLWESANTIGCRNLMRSYHQDIFTFGNFIAVFRSRSITLYAITDDCVKQINLTEALNIQEGTFQYPKFSAFNDKFFALPFQAFPGGPRGRPDEMPMVSHRIYCWEMKNFTVSTLVMDTETDPHNIFIKTAVSDTHCYGLQLSKLITWNIETSEIVRQTSLGAPGVGVGDIHVGSQICCLLLSRQGSMTVQKSHLGLFSFEGKLLGKIEIQGELFSITKVFIFNKRVVVEKKALGSKTITILTADLTSILGSFKEGSDYEANILPVEVYKWENNYTDAGELFFGESDILKNSETAGIHIESFWPSGF